MNTNQFTCPDSPNCVSSVVTNERHYIEPLTYSGSDQAAWDQLITIVGELKRSKITQVSETSLSAEFRTALFRFVDDTHFQLRPELNRIEVRSSSRTGTYDMGVNRKRVEKIRSLLNESLAPELWDI